MAACLTLSSIFTWTVKYVFLVFVVMAFCLVMVCIVAFVMMIFIVMVLSIVAFFIMMVFTVMFFAVFIILMGFAFTGPTDIKRYWALLKKCAFFAFSSFMRCTYVIAFVCLLAISSFMRFNIFIRFIAFILHVVGDVFVLAYFITANVNVYLLPRPTSTGAAYVIGITPAIVLFSKLYAALCIKLFASVSLIVLPICHCIFAIVLAILEDEVRLQEILEILHDCTIGRQKRGASRLGDGSTAWMERREAQGTYLQETCLKNEHHLGEGGHCRSGRSEPPDHR